MGEITDKENYIAIGHSQVIGDLIEIIHLNNGILTKIVQNVPETLYDNRPSLKQRLEKLQDRNFNRNSVNHFYPISIQPIDDFKPQKGEKYIIGFTGFKMSKLVRYLIEKFGIEFAPLIHPSAIVAPDVCISSGAIVQAGVIIASGVKLNEHIFINKGVNIGCKTVIERFASLAPGTNIGQNTAIGTGVTLGIGSVILDGIVVRDYSIVAAGATVIEDVPSNTLVAGNPAIIKKTNLYKTFD